MWDPCELIVKYVHYPLFRISQSFLHAKQWSMTRCCTECQRRLQPLEQTPPQHIEVRGDADRSRKIQLNPALYSQPRENVYMPPLYSTSHF
jgi:hypothetical protein